MPNALMLLSALAVTSATLASEEITEIRKIRAQDLGSLDFFGRSIDATTSRVVVGAPYDGLGGFQAGAAYIFNPNSGQRLFKIIASDAEDGLVGGHFGFSVAATDTRAIIGSPFGNDGVAGAVYLFDILTGEELQKLTPSDPSFFDRFGTSLAVSGNNRLVIGASGDGAAGEDAGAAYIFDVQTGLELLTIYADDASPNDQLGSSVDISGNLVVAASPEADTAAGNGAAYIFHAISGQQIQKLFPIDATPSAQFADSVAISGNLVVVGAPDPQNPGSAYIFDAQSGDQLHRLVAPGGEPNDQFGNSVDIDGDRVIVGAEGESGSEGAAYVFDASSGQLLYKLIASDPEADDRLGFSVALAGDLAFAGAVGDDVVGPDTGSAYIFDITPCFADVNNDNTVDLADLNIILASFGQTTTIGDTNFDGVIDLADLNRVLSEFGTDCP